MIAILTHKSSAYNPEIWRSLAGSFCVPTIFVRGGSVPGFTTDSPEHKKPGTMVLVATPDGASGMGLSATELGNFEHPTDATYAFGPDDSLQGWSQEESEAVCVTIPTPGGTQLFSYVAAGIVLWDRVVKNGNY